jgi:hypothetical protein
VALSAFAVVCLVGGLIAGHGDSLLGFWIAWTVGALAALGALLWSILAYRTTSGAWRAITIAAIAINASVAALFPIVVWLYT